MATVELDSWWDIVWKPEEETSNGNLVPESKGHYTHMSCVCTRLEHCELPVTGAHDEKVFSVTD